MSSMGIGQGLAEGVRTAGQFVMQGMQMGQRKKLAQQSMDADMAWRRAYAGLPPAYEEADQAMQAAQTRPAIPSSEPTSTPGPLGFPQSSFDTGQPVAPMPQASRSGGASSLVPPMSMMRPSRRRLY